MSEAETEIRVPDAYDDVDEWATAAVRGGANWLVTLRNAIDEGIKPWSDDYTAGETGIMTYSEGLTSLALVKQFAPTDNPDWKDVRQRYYQEDLEYIVGEINSEDGPHFKPSPYLNKKIDKLGDEADKAKLETNDFTVAATFATSAILESLKADIEFGDDIHEDDIENALDTSLNWLLSNSTETDDGVGWGGIGSTSADGEEKRNYFTYSAILVLCDFLLYSMHEDENENVDIVKSVVSNYTDELKSTLEQAKEFLLNKHWDKNGGHWTAPGMRPSDEEELLSTCYTFIGLSYLEYTGEKTTVDLGLELSTEEKEKMGQAANWLIEKYENDPNIWVSTVEYTTGNSGLTDGSLPYVLLDTFSELVGYRKSILNEHVQDYDLDGVRRQKGKLANVVLDNCWSGDENYERKGFRHVEEGQDLVDDDKPDGNPEKNPTVVYSSGVAIETLLLNFLDEGEKIEERDESESNRPTTTSTEPTEETEEVQDKTVNVFLNGEGGDDPDEIDEDIEGTIKEIHKEVSGLSEEIKEGIRESGGDEGDIEIEEFNERSREFMDSLSEYDSILAKEYLRKNDWKEDVCENVQADVHKGLQESWPDKFRQRNKEMFIGYLSRLYFCPDKETYEKEVKTQKFKDNSKYLLPPQYQAYNKVEGWEEERFTDEGTRKRKLEEMLEELKREPWGNDDIIGVLSDFTRRYESD